MSEAELHKVIQHLRSVLVQQDADRMTDGELLQRYLQQRDEAAFEALVRRHGPMVLAVCRRVLHSFHDAEDAFQATFLVLVRKAASLRSGSRVGNWLYGVAFRTAQEAKRAALKRRTKEAKAAPKAGASGDSWSELREALDRELERLPQKYRAVVVLCDLQGASGKEAARNLALPEGTVASRLARGRALLAKRLARHGVALSGGSLAAMLAHHGASASVPTSLLVSTARAATVLMTGQTASAGVISARVASLAEGVLRIMLLNKLKVTGAVLLMAVGTIVGTGTLMLSVSGANEKHEQEKKAVARAPAAGGEKYTMLADAVKEFNQRAQQDATGKDQPALTEDEVVAAIRGWDRERVPAPDEVYKVYQTIADTKKLPEGARLTFTTKWSGFNNYEFDVWWVGLDIMTGPDRGYTFRIRDRKLRCRLLDATASGQAVPASKDEVPGQAAEADRGEPVSRGKPLSEWIKTLKDKDYSARERAAEAIGELGPKAKGAVPALREAMAIKGAVQSPPAAALFKVDRATFIAILKRKQADYDVERFTEILALTSIGPAAKELTPVVLAIAQDRKDSGNREHALLALGFIGADPKVVVPVLQAGLRDMGQYARYLSAQALGALGPQAKEALPDLYAALNDPDPQVRVDAAGAVWKIEKRAASLVPVLTDALTALRPVRPQSTVLVVDEAARQRATRYLGEIGAEAKAAFPVLLKLWQGETSDYRRGEYAAALKTIDASAAAKAGVR